MGTTTFILHSSGARLSPLSSGPRAPRGGWALAVPSGGVCPFLSSSKARLTTAGQVFLQDKVASSKTSALLGSSRAWTYKSGLCCRKKLCVDKRKGGRRNWDVHSSRNVDPFGWMGPRTGL